MAGLCRRAIFQSCQRMLSTSAVRCRQKAFADPLDHATGIEKRELLAQAAGNDDPYYMKVIKRSTASTKDSPNLVPSVFTSRVIGCVCDEDASSVNWMWLHDGAPRRCECGHWFKLIQKPPL